MDEGSPTSFQGDILYFGNCINCVVPDTGDPETIPGRLSLYAGGGTFHVCVCGLSSFSGRHHPGPAQSKETYSGCRYLAAACFYFCGVDWGGLCFHPGQQEARALAKQFPPVPMMVPTSPWESHGHTSRKGGLGMGSRGDR